MNGGRQAHDAPDGRREASARLVTIVQRVLPHYRVAFFRQLHERLAREGIALQVVYGQEYPGTVPKTQRLDADWARMIRNRYWRLGGAELVWQPCLSLLHGSDLVIIEQANRLVLNYLLLLRRRFSGGRLAYWGHGRNMQAAGGRRLRERMKKTLLDQVDWWFAYTEPSAEAVVSAGFPPERVTTVNNTVDTDELTDAVQHVTGESLAAVRTELRIRSENVCIYCGGLYRDKRLAFLIEACDRIRARIPDFELVVVGDGPDRTVIEEAARRCSWIHFVGPRYGAERVRYFGIAKAQLLPGLVGLAIIDSFVTRTPIFTTDIPIHSPEIAYLRSGVNGVMAPDRMEAYAGAVIDYLSSPAMQRVLQSGCAASAAAYTLDRMVERFATGVMDSLRT